MTEVLKRGRRGHRIFYGGGSPKAALEFYQMLPETYQVIADKVADEQVFGDAYHVVVGEGLSVGFSQPFAPRTKEIEPLNTKSYFPEETLLENVPFVQSHGGWLDYNVMLPHSSLRNQIMHHVPWNASEWLTRWVGQISPKETPEHFELSPSSERRTTGKVRKYYEPASFLFVDDDEVDVEDTEH